MYLLTKYIKRVLWGVTVRLSYIQDARCLKVKLVGCNTNHAYHRRIYNL
jgi:hypothetical protein